MHPLTSPNTTSDFKQGIPWYKPHSPSLLPCTNILRPSLARCHIGLSADAPSESSQSGDPLETLPRFIQFPRWARSSAFFSLHLSPLRQCFVRASRKLPTGPIHSFLLRPQAQNVRTKLDRG